MKLFYASNFLISYAVIIVLTGCMNINGYKYPPGKDTVEAFGNGRLAILTYSTNDVLYAGESPSITGQNEIQNELERQGNLPNALQKFKITRCL